MARWSSTTHGANCTRRGPDVQKPAGVHQRRPDQHHQLVLASGRPADATFSTVMQISHGVEGQLQLMNFPWAWHSRPSELMNREPSPVLLYRLPWLSQHPPALQLVSSAGDGGARPDAA